MAHFKFDMDERKCLYEIDNGDKFDFFKITLKEDKKEIYGLVNVYEAKLLIEALNQYIEKKSPRITR